MWSPLLSLSKLSESSSVSSFPDVDEEEDGDLVAIDGSQLFPEHVTWLGMRRGRLLRGYMYDFMRLFAPHLTRKLVDQALRAASPERAGALFESVRLPRY